METKNITSPEQNTFQITVKIDKLFDSPDRKLKAFASATIGAFSVHGIKIYENEKGLFATMPSISRKISDGTTVYDEVFHPVTVEARKALTDSVITAYKNALEHAHSADSIDRKNGPTMQM